MADHGGGASEPLEKKVPRSRLDDYAEMAVPPRKGPAAGRAPWPDPGAEPISEAPEPAPALDDPEVEARRQRFLEVLEEFRRTPVLVPLGDGPGPDHERGLLTADRNGVRFILAFSDGPALARYAEARGEFHREWVYQTILGARLLDVAVPAAGMPCGVALDCADGPDGVVFPPVRGVVPDEVAVDREEGTAA
ncbi:hypothetical protein ABZ330_33855 [Streptomyces sp. NPDC006172]|uniref:hypothetical protein n=1 Tax=Streptomyces sp. NPDC006172 TaxID=3154470 RepID=UPI0033CE49FC